MTQVRRWTSTDLLSMPKDGNLYEIIDGELYVTTQPTKEHQLVCTRAASLLDRWNEETALGHVLISPGLVFADDEDVAPDAVWVSRERLRVISDSHGHFHSAPELIIEVLSPGAANRRRDREAKLRLYSRHGVLEYWIINWERRHLDIYCRVSGGLELTATLEGDALITSPLLPGFARPVGDLFSTLP